MTGAISSSLPYHIHLKSSSIPLRDKPLNSPEKGSICKSGSTNGGGHLVTLISILFFPVRVPWNLRLDRSLQCLDLWENFPTDLYHLRVGGSHGHA
jgi:hypothetical protein